MEFKLRGWLSSDAQSLCENANNVKIYNNLRNRFPSPYTMDDAKEYIASCKQGEGRTHIIRAVEVDGKAVGSVGVFFKDDVCCKSAELGYWIGEEYWNNGIMTEAVEQLCEFVFENYDIARIFAEPFAANIGSRRVLEKAGFEFEGLLKNSVFKNGKLIDSCMYALLSDSIGGGET